MNTSLIINIFIQVINLFNINLKMPKNVAKDLVLRDIMSNQGKILILPDIEDKFQITLDILAYNTLCSAIPQA